VPEDLTVPVTIITAADDPLVPVEDFYDLSDIDCLELLIQRYGGTADS
jgi:predicted alpha/beta-fold hydrolase